MQSNRQLHPRERSDAAQAPLLGTRGLLQMLLHPRRGRSRRTTAPAPPSPTTRPYSSASDGLNRNQPALEQLPCWARRRLPG